MASRDLNDADPRLRVAFTRIKASFEAAFPGYELRPTTVYRSPAEQKKAFDEGKSQLDGTTKVGNHNYHPSRAIDVGIFKKQPQGMPAAWIDELLEAKRFDATLYRSLYWNFGLLVQRAGLRWGGDWDGDGLLVVCDDTESLNDPYHMELPKEA